MQFDLNRLFVYIRFPFIHIRGAFHILIITDYGKTPLFSTPTHPSLITNHGVFVIFLLDTKTDTTTYTNCVWAKNQCMSLSLCTSSFENAVFQSERTNVKIASFFQVSSLFDSSLMNVRVLLESLGGLNSRNYRNREKV